MDNSNNTKIEDVLVGYCLSELLISNLTNISYKLTVEEIEWITEFVRLSPESFENISNNIHLILKDGKIDLYDIPAIIKLIADIYHTDINNIKFNGVYLIKLIEYTLDILLESQLIKIDIEQKEKIKLITKSSLTLLTTNIDYNFINNSKKYFKCCLLC